MKLFRISIIRVIAAIVAGILLLKYDDSVLKGLTIALGIMFLIAGLVSLIGWMNARRQKAEFRAYDNGKQSSDESQPMFPIVGLGSVLLGCILSLTETEAYRIWAMYLIAAVIILGALNQIMNLVAARKMEPVEDWMWLPPIAIAIASVVAMLKGLVPPRTTTTILGITAFVYALVEIVYSIKFYQIKQRFTTTQTQVKRANEVNGDAQLVPTEDVTNRY